MQVRANSIVADTLMVFALLLAATWVALGAYQNRSYGFDLTTGTIYFMIGLAVYVIVLLAGGASVFATLQARGDGVRLSTRTICLSALTAMVIAAPWVGWPFLSFLWR